jgi:galactonate dehydratase
VKITAIKGFPVKVGHRNEFVVKIETDNGLYGLGEGGISGHELAMLGMLDHVSGYLVGQDPRRIEHIWQTVYRGAYFEGGKILAATLSAIDVALWDILGKSLNAPVWQLLGGACRQHVPCFATPGSLTGPKVIEQAKEFTAAGWRVQRYMPGSDKPGWTGGDGSVFEPLEAVELSAHWLREVRKAVGPSVELAIDFHHRLNVVETALFCAKVADLNLFFIEEPIRCENPKAYQQLRTMTTIPFAIGEEFSSKWAFAPYIEEGITNFARVDISNVGGLTEARKVAAFAETHYIDMMPHNPLGPVTTAASIHFAAACPNFAYLEYQHVLSSQYPEDLFPTMPKLNGDVFPLPTEPGLGVTFNEDALADHAYAYWEAPHWQRRDGSYTNW